MDETIKLRDIFLGEIDGETESQKSNFLSLFYNENSKYDDIMKQEKFIISGKKGTGKTILAQYIEKNNNDKICKIYNLKDLKIQQLIDLNNQKLDYDYISAFCKWFILKKIADLILDNATLFSQHNFFGPTYKLKKFYKKIYSEDVFKITSYTSEDFSKRTEGDTIDAKLVDGIKVGTKASKETSKRVNINYEKKKFYELIETLEKKITKALSEKNSFIVMFDDLDELDGKIGENKFYRDLIIKMLETVKMMNNTFYSLNIELKIIVMLRSDIISTLQKYSSNLNKLITSGEVNLYWIEKDLENPEKHPIMDMVLSKIQQSNKNFQTYTKKDIYKKLFPEKIDDKEVINYLLDYSFGRPRDIIRYLNIIKEQYPDETLFKAAYIRSCRQLYSNWFYDELLNELNIHVNPKYVTDILDLINDFKRISFKFDEIEEFYSSNKDTYKHIKNLKEALQLMYTFGVIGNSWQKKSRHPNAKSKYLYSWGYRKDANDKLNFSQSFVVHYGFRKKFSI